MSKYIDAEKLLEKEKALLKRLMAFRNALAGEEAKCADARIKLLERECVRHCWQTRRYQKQHSLRTEIRRRIVP